MSTIATTLYDAIVRRLEDNEVETALLDIAENVGTVATLDGLARVLARIAYSLGDNPEGTTYAAHALAVHDAAMRLQDDLAALDRAKRPSEWL